MNAHLRPIEKSDLEALVYHANNPLIAKNMTNRFPHPYTKKNGEDFIAFANKMDPPNILAIDIDGEFCGAVGVHPQDDVKCKNAEIGFWVAEQYWNKGIATAMVKQLIDYAFDNFDISRVFAAIYGYNEASKKVVRKLGFTEEAHLKNTIFKNSVYTDEYIFGLRRDSHTSHD